MYWTLGNNLDHAGTRLSFIRKKKLDLEKSDPGVAIKNYVATLKKEKLNSHIYHRLMILYRKQKDYKKEADLIKTAIHFFEAYYVKHQPSHSPRVTSLSRALAISTGLSTKKGRSLYDPEPIATWRKRLHNLQKKIK